MMVKLSAPQTFKKFGGKPTVALRAKVGNNSTLLA
jgi:hypothetical protein